MRVIALRTLREFWQKHPQAETPLRSWHKIVSKAEWTGPADVKTDFGGSVDFVADNRSFSILEATSFGSLSMWFTRSKRP